ncbi:MAG: type IV pilin [Theionarchaea archaeon]|nr:type IV pilin [Theionarchaea archaeon]
MKRRGVSPIIATVLMITIVMAMVGTVAVWVNSQSQQAMNREGERRERIANRANELLELIDVDEVQGTLTILNNGTSDSVITYVVLNETYVRDVEFQDPSAAEVDIGAFTTITLTDPAVLANVVLVEVGTELGNTFLFTAPSAVILVESTFFSYGNKLVVLDGTASTDSDSSIVLWEWDLNGDGDFDDVDDRTGQRISVTFPSGSHTITLRITDDTGLTSNAMITIEVPP